ncbi:hypothetical protein PHYPSEUDO_001052 [Phytophthora pseudosyringae]|uniref:Uncharacterized protein n=1 Tax=Phytophthora pseudosyringae TaxID=221518 RepID=A0A8T1VWV9_9STRA|nr:hypothetical protein PHYPSEUDO_001052 [Phytophthora pseudosyringae]
MMLINDQLLGQDKLEILVTDPLKTQHKKTLKVGDRVCKKLVPNLKILCCSVAGFLKLSCTLLSFHTLNFLVAIGAELCVVVMLVSLALTFLLVRAILVVGGLARIEEYLESQLSARSLFCLHIAIGCLGLALALTWTAIFLVLMWIVLLFAFGIMGAAVLNYSFAAMGWLVRADVWVASIVGPTAQLDLSARIGNFLIDLSKRFEFANNDSGLLSIKMTCQAWTTVLYFTLPKFIMGVLSAGVVGATVIQPGIFLVWGGATFHEKATHFAAGFVLMLMVWVAAIVPTTSLSVQLTSQVFNERDEVQDNGQQSCNITSILAPTSTQGRGRSYYVDLEAMRSPISVLTPLSKA